RRRAGGAVLPGRDRPARREVQSHTAGRHDMSDIASRFKEGGRGIFGIPARALTVAAFEATPADQPRAVKPPEAYQQADTPELDAPLRSLSNEQYATLTPAQKAARTRAANAADQDPQEPTTGDAEEGE